jgi:hypothetical protein
MKILKTALGVCFIVCSLHSAAQTPTIPLNEPNYNKPRLFADLPQKLDIDLSALESLFTLPVGSPVSSRISNSFRFEGTVAARSSEDDPALKSIVLRSTNRQGATLTLTRRTNADGSFTWLGRMISMQHADAYELILDNGSYVLNKTGFYDLLSE